MARALAGLGLLAYVLAGLLHVAIADDAPFMATVDRVKDGDSLLVKDLAGATHEIRLSEIDAPEYRQPWSRQSKRALVRLLGSGTIRIEPVTRDRYNRIVADVYRDDINVGRRMVRDGFAWVFRRYLRDRTLLDVEKEARDAGRGLWSDPRARRIPPWKWRDALKPGRGDETSPVIGNRRTLRYHLPERCPGYSTVARKHRRRFTTEDEAKRAGYERAGNCTGGVVTAPARSSDVPDGPVTGNRRSRIYHWRGCPGLAAMSPGNRVVFSDARGAEAAGYRPARNC